MFRRTAMAALFIAGCSYTVPAEHAVAPEVDLRAEAGVIVGSLGEIGEGLEGTESADLEMAWQDLDDDLRSVVADVVDRPDSVDIAGVRTRVEGFLVRFGSTEEVSRINGHWDRLVASLGTMANRIEIAAGQVGSSAAGQVGSS